MFPRCLRWPERIGYTFIPTAPRFLRVYYKKEKKTPRDLKLSQKASRPDFKTPSNTGKESARTRARDMTLHTHPHVRACTHKHKRCGPLDRTIWVDNQKRQFSDHPRPLSGAQVNLEINLSRVTQRHPPPLAAFSSTRPQRKTAYIWYSGYGQALQVSITTVFNS